MVETRERTAPPEVNPDSLRAVLVQIDSILKKDSDSFGKGTVPATINRLLGVTVYSIMQIQKAAFQPEVDIMKLDGKKNGYRTYDRSGVLAFAAVCFVVIESFKVEHPLKISWSEIIDKTNKALGDNPIKNKILPPINADSMLTINTNFEQFFVGRYQTKSRNKQEKKPTEDLDAWDSDRVSGVLKYLPYDRFNDVSFSAHIPEAIAEVLMRIAFRFNNREFDYQPEDSILAVDLEGAIKICEGLFKEGVHGNNLGQLQRSVLNPNFENGRGDARVA